CRSNTPVQFILFSAFFSLGGPSDSSFLALGRWAERKTPPPPTPSHSSSRPPTGVQLHSAPTDPGTHKVDGPSEMRDPGAPGDEEIMPTSCWTFPWTRQSGQHAGNRLSGGSSALPLVMPSSWALEWLDPVWQVQDINSGETSLGNFLNMSECGCSPREIWFCQWYLGRWALYESAPRRNRDGFVVVRHISQQKEEQPVSHTLWSIESLMNRVVLAFHCVPAKKHIWWDWHLITGYIAAPLRFPQLVPYYVGTTMQKQKHLTNARRHELVGSHDVTLQLFQRCLPQLGEGGRHRQNGVEEARKVGGKRLIRPLVGWCGWLIVYVGGNGHSTY
ncbi:hypothetical protein CCUS01_01015, partial [Colletotrichum cuscutae]